MSDRNRKNLGRSNRIKDQGSRPNSANVSGRNTPDPRSSNQPTVDPLFSDQFITDPRFSGQATSDQQRIAGPSRRQRSPVPQHTPYPSFSGLATPNQQPITGLYLGQPILEATSGGYPGPYSGSLPTVDPHLGGQSIADPRFSGQLPSYQHRFTDPYGSQRFPVPQPASYPIFGVQATSNQQRIIEPYGSQPILEATSGGNPGPYYNNLPTFDPRFNDRSTIDPRFSGQSTSYQQRFTDPYGAQRLPATPYPSFSGQATPNQHRITGPYRGQPTLEATSSGHPVLRSSGQPINNGIYTITNVHQKRFVYLEDANDKTPLRGHFNQQNRGVRWHVIQRVDGEYSIKNVEYGRYAYCGSRAQLDAFVEGHSEEQVWRIQERHGGQYTIEAIDSGNLWMLPDKEKDTPVTFSKVPSDPICLWSFESAESVAPVNENLVALPFIPNTGLSLAPSSGQPMPDAAILEFTSVIAGAPNLLPPLRAAGGALRAVLQMAESIGHINEDWKVLIKRLKFHLATVENDIAKLEEDQKIDEIVPALNKDVRESLETYARELKEIYALLSDNEPESSSQVRKVTSFGRNIGIIADKTLKIDKAFQRYMAALHQFAADTVTQMQQQLAQFGQESQQGAEKAHTAAENARPNRPNAYGIQHRECLQGTREKTLPAISDWVDDENAKNWIFFFLDVAGSGKSTVAKHMAEKWKREDRLLARFFFSRDTTETMSTNSFCSTVAGAFAALDPTYKENMDKFMKVPNVELLPFEERFQGLIVGPLRAIGRRAILIIDALDECHPEQRDQLLQTLRDQHKSIPLLRILATGRPERDIKYWADKKFSFGYANFIRLEESEKDVELYIEHRLRDLPIAQDRLYPVIRHAEGLFIWARIACDLLVNSLNINSLLEELGKEVTLDYLYKVALEQSTPKDEASRRVIVMVLQMILAAKEPLSIAELEMLSPNRDVVEKVVTSLGSVLLYQGREGPIRLLHATFREFLTGRSKADTFFIQLELGHHTLASGCLTTISDLSKQDRLALPLLDAISERKEVSFEQDTY